jgi:hypothetical protein
MAAKALTHSRCALVHLLSHNQKPPRDRRGLFMLVVILRWQRIAFVTGTFIAAVDAAIDARPRSDLSRFMHRLEGVVRVSFLYVLFVAIESHNGLLLIAVPIGTAVRGRA